MGRFELGVVCATPGALGLLGATGTDHAELLKRHHGGDWGEVDAHDEELPLPHDWARVIHLATASVTFVTNTLRGFEDYL